MRLIFFALDSYFLILNTYLMDILEVFILSAVEGITEFLPISSTGHLILASDLLRIPNSEFLKTFQIAIQSGAVLAVINLYFRKLLSDLSLVKKALFGLIPTILAGIILYPFLRDFLLESVQTVSISLIVGGIFILFIERRLKSSGKNSLDQTTDLSKVTYKQAFLTGLTQSIAIIPGVSRAGASIFGAILFGMNRKTATEFSFILATPTILAATGFDLIQTAPAFSQQEIINLALGIILSYVFALIAIKWLIKYVSTHTFNAFGWYRIILGIIFLLFLL